jgi:hypothetical protein
MTDREYEKDRARRASIAMDAYMDEFLKSREEEIYRAFTVCPPYKTEELQRLKFAHAAVTDIRVAIEQDIITGTILQPKE